MVKDVLTALAKKRNGHKLIRSLVREKARENCVEDRKQTFMDSIINMMSVFPGTITAFTLHFYAGLLVSLT